MLNEIMWISDADGIHNFGVQYFGYRPKEFSEMVNRVSSELGIKDIFWQGGHYSKKWRYYEFWLFNQDKMLNFCIRLSEEMGIECLNRNPTRKEWALLYMMEKRMKIENKE